MLIDIYQIVFIVVALTYTVTSKGYGHGRYTTGTTVGGVGGRPTLGGMGRSTYVGRTGGRGPLVGMGRFPGIAGSFAGRVGGSAPFAGSYGGGVGTGSLRQPRYYGMSPQPYSTSYEAMDEQGGTQFKTEFGDESGNVQGKYGYFDSQRLYRQVEYTADQFGFRANIKTNEPGVGKESPADVNMIVKQTPAGIQEQYTPATAYQTGMSGQRGVEGIYGIGPVVKGFQGGISSGSPPSAGYPDALFVGGPASLRYPGCGMPGSSKSACGARAQSGSSGLFARIKKSLSGKSMY